MSKHPVEPRTTDSIVDDLNRVRETISARAYELFRNHDDLWSGPLGDWLRAERELVWRPTIELREKDSRFELTAAVAGIDPKDLDVQVTAEDILIQSNKPHEHNGSAGTVHVCEFESGRLFRSVHLPARIDPATVKAEYRNGLLRLTAAIAKAEPTKVEIQAA